MQLQHNKTKVDGFIGQHRILTRSETWTTDKINRGDTWSRILYLNLVPETGTRSRSCSIRCKFLKLSRQNRPIKTHNCFESFWYHELASNFWYKKLVHVSGTRLWACVTSIMYNQISISHSCIQLTDKLLVTYCQHSYNYHHNHSPTCQVLPTLTTMLITIFAPTVQFTSFLTLY